MGTSAMHGMDSEAAQTAREPQGVACRRRFPRYRTDLPASIRNHDERTVEGRCFVIAEGGLGMQLREPIPVGSVVQLQLALPSCPALVSVWAIVRYQLDLHHGFEFVSLTDADRAAICEFCRELAMQQSSPQRDCAP